MSTDPAVSVDGVTMVSLTSYTTTSTEATSSTPTATSTTAAPTISFVDTVQLATCQSAVFNWSLINFSSDLKDSSVNLYISDNDEFIPWTALLGTTAASAGQFIWTQVTLPAGSDYGIQVEMADTEVVSSAQSFKIINGTSTSCVTGVIEPVESASSSSTALASATSAASSSPSATHKSYTGTIIGAVISGAAVVILALLVALAYLRRKNKYSQRMPTTRISPRIRPASPARSELTIVEDTYDASKLDKLEPSYGI